MRDDAAQAIGGPGVPASAGWERAGATVAALFREHHLELVRLALVMTGDLATAEDAVQDTFERLYRRWTGLRISSTGRAGKLTPLPVKPVGVDGSAVSGIALSPGGRYPSSQAEVRLLNPAAPGHNLLASRVIVRATAVPGAAIQTALVAADGRSVVAW